MPMRSLRLGVVGKADVVEFHRDTEHSEDLWRPFPVEYKRGKPKKDNYDKVQLCAQALFEVLPRDTEDWKLMNALLSERETLRIKEKQLGIKEDTLFYPAEEK